jgi:hypothetical protein
MNHLLYNISIIMLLSGLFILTNYLSKTYYLQKGQVCPKPEIPEKEPTIEESYNMRPTQIFDVMFMKPSIWQGYESVIVPKNTQK